MRALRTILSWLPPGIRLPIGAGLIVFAAAVGTTQVALRLETRQADAQIERVGLVYLDGLVASVRPALEAGDLDEVIRRFDAAFREQHGISERALVAIDDGGQVVARVGDAASASVISTVRHGDGFGIDEASGIAWITRKVGGASGYWVGAGLDVGEILAARRRRTVGVALIDLLIGAVCGVLTYMVLHRLNRPVHLLMTHMEASAGGSPDSVSSKTLETLDVRMRPVFEAYNRMAEGIRERERLFADLAENEQTAALGRLAATIAHEVRNPLGGLSTAVSTLRKFGDDPQVRDEALGLLERGIESLDRIVTSTLNLHRPEEERRLTRVDFEDLVQLVRPAAERDDVILEWSLDLPRELSVGAHGVRQVLLNLLLNACAACRPGGRVALEAYLDGGDLICVVSDEGDGMQPAAADRLEGSGRATSSAKRLGMDVIVALLGSLDGRASVRSEAGKGTIVRVALPLALT